MGNLTGLDLPRLRNRSLAVGSEAPSNSVTPLFQRPITRRLALQAGALGAATLAALGDVGPIFRRFRFHYHEGRALFYLGSDLLWVVDPERFAGRPRLRVEESPRSIDLSLRNARYPGTRVPADFRCRCRASAFGWWLHLRMDFLRFEAASPLESWLEGAEPLRFQSAAAAGSRLLGSRTGPAALALRGPVHVDFSPSWQLRLSGRSALALTLGENEVLCNSAALSLPEPGSSSLSALVSRKRSWFDFARDQADWSPLSRAWSVEDGELSIAGNAFETLQFEADETPAGRRLFFLARSRPGAEAGRLDLGPTFQKEGRSFALRLAGVRLAGAFEPSGRQVAVLADLHGEAPWLEGTTTRLKLGNPADTAAFELVERDGRTERIALAPALHATVTAFEGALGLETPPPEPTRVALLARPGEKPVAGLCATACGCPQGAGLEVSLPDLCFSVLRPEDLLILRFELRNLRLRDRWLCKPWLERIDPTQPAFLVVHFPPQHVAETAFFENAAGTDQPTLESMQSRIAGESRLAFKLAEKYERLDFDLPTLLNWDPAVFEPVLAPAIRKEDEIAPPLPGQTDVEFPWRLHLSPDPGSVWRHATEPVSHEGRTELWHSRLTPAETNGAPPSVRAVWADFDEQEPPGWHQPGEHMRPFRTSLRDLDRYRIVEATHRSDTDPAPVGARLLALSALGAWSDLYGEWPCNPLRACNPLDRWHHIATFGRDQFVRVELRGFLFPLGHRATLIIETRRRLQPFDYVLDGEKRRTFIAFLRQRKFIKIREHVRDYGNWDMACRRVEILDEKTPNLNDPSDPAEPNGGAIPKADGTTWGGRAFWPTVGTAVFRFHVRATDYAGNLPIWEMPLIFVEQSCDTPNGMPEELANSERLKEVARHYAASPRRILPLTGQTLAMAPALRKGDTEVAVETLEFDSRLRIDPPQEPCDPGYIPPDSEFARVYADPCEPPFWPVLKQIRARVPAIESFLGASQVAALTPLSIACDDAFEAFARLASPGEIQAGFHDNSDRSGGVLGPSPSISHLSRRFGPVGLRPSPADDAAGGAPLDTPVQVPPTTSGGAFFSPDATILGTLELREIIGVLDPSKGQVPALLSLIRPNADGLDLLEQSLNWSTRTLQELDLGILAFLPSSNTELALNGSLSVWIGQPDAVRFSMQGALSDFDVRIGWSSAGVLIHFNSLSYSAGSDGATGFDIKLGKVSFLGALAFIQKLAEQLQSLLGKKAGVEIDLQPDGVAVWMPPINFDKLEFGIFAIKNLNIRSWARLPFKKQPVEFGFALGRADSPCELSVGIFGGRAHVLAVLDTANGGIRYFEAAFEFGALRELSFGPAHGQVYILGGVFFSISVEKDDQGRNVRVIRLAAYVRAGGSVDVLGLITAYIDLYIGLLYEDNGQRSYLVGEASLTIGFKIGFIEHSVTLRRTERLAGSASSGSQQGSAWRLAALGTGLPGGEDGNAESQAVRFEDAMPLCEWQRYQAAFA